MSKWGLLVLALMAGIVGVLVWAVYVHVAYLS